MTHKYQLAPVTAVVLSAYLAASAGCQTGEHERLSSTEFDAFLTQVFALDMTPGMAVAVVHGADLVYARGFGYADIETGREVTPETMFYIASTTKSFTAFAAQMLHHRGEFDLDAPLSRYLPRIDFASPLSADEITIRDLLTMSHGISDGGPVVFRTAFSGDHTHEQLVDLLGQYEPSPTGRAFDYGNLGYNVVSLAMDRALDSNWKEVLHREVFEPLGMTNTTAYRSRVDEQRLAMPHRAEPRGFERSHYAKGDENMHAAGGHLSTVLDLAKWIEVHLNGGRLNGEQIFPETVIAETHRKQVDQDRDFAWVHRFGWGLGWDLGDYEGDTVIHRHGGFSGFRSHVSFMPSHGIGVTVQVNSGLGSPMTDFVARYIYDRLLEKSDLTVRYDSLLNRLRERAASARENIAQDRARRAARSQTLPHPLEAYAGVYENPELGRIEWRLVEGKLEATMGLLWSAVEVYDGEQNQLRVELTGGGEVVEFTLAGGGPARSLTYAGREFDRVER